MKVSITILRGKDGWEEAKREQGLELLGEIRNINIMLRQWPAVLLVFRVIPVPGMKDLVDFPNGTIVGDLYIAQPDQFLPLDPSEIEGIWPQVVQILQGNEIEVPTVLYHDLRRWPLPRIAGQPAPA